MCVQIKPSNGFRVLAWVVVSDQLSKDRPILARTQVTPFSLKIERALWLRAVDKVMLGGTVFYNLKTCLIQRKDHNPVEHLTILSNHLRIHKCARLALLRSGQLRIAARLRRHTVGFKLPKILIWLKWWSSILRIHTIRNSTKLYSRSPVQKLSACLPRRSRHPLGPMVTAVEGQMWMMTQSLIWILMSSREKLRMSPR